MMTATDETMTGLAVFRRHGCKIPETCHWHRDQREEAVP